MTGAKRPRSRQGRWPLALSLAVLAVRPGASQDVPLHGEEIGVTVQAVVVWAAVNDRRGRPERDLERPDFQVLDDGVPQKIAEFELGSQTTLSVQILVDASKSMEISGLLAGARTGVHHLLSRLSPRDQASLWYFAGRRTWPDCPMGTPYARIGEATDALVGRGETTLRDSLLESLGAPGGQVLSRRAVFLFTDGKDNASTASDEDIAIVAGSLNVPIHAIILTPRPERDIEPAEYEALRRIVELSGGQSMIATPFDDEGPVEAIDKALDQLRSSYVLEYSPDGPTRRGFHRIEVRTSCRKCVVMHRRGYYTR